MSEENVEVVLEGIRRFEASDFEGVSRRWHPDTDPVHRGRDVSPDRTTGSSPVWRRR
jgi:hypothetical protein